MSLYIRYPAIGGGGGGSVTGVTASSPLASSGGTAPNISLTGVVTVPNGGTGLNTLTANALLVGNGTGNITAIAPGTNGNVIQSNGTTWAVVNTPFANRQLSNLSLPTVNATINPITTNNIDLGSTTRNWNNLFINVIQGTAGSSSVYTVSTGVFKDNSAGQVSLDLKNRLLANSSGTTVLNYSGTSLDANTHPIINVVNPTNAQDAATKAYVDSKVSAGFMGSIKWASVGGAFWTVASPGGFTNMTPVGSIPTPTVTNKATNPGSNIVGVTFASMPAGTYRFVAYGDMYQTGGNGTQHAFRFSDGTNTTNGINMHLSIASGLAFSTVEGIIRYATAQSNVTIQLQGLVTGTDVILADLTTFSLEIDVYFFPDA